MRVPAREGEEVMLDENRSRWRQPVYKTDPLRDPAHDAGAREGERGETIMNEEKPIMNEEKRSWRRFLALASQHSLSRGGSLTPSVLICFENLVLNCFRGKDE